MKWPKIEIELEPMTQKDLDQCRAWFYVCTFLCVLMMCGTIAFMLIASVARWLLE